MNHYPIVKGFGETMADAMTMCQEVLQDYLDITDKESIILELSKNRLYVWYSPAGMSENSECLVYNYCLLMDFTSGM